jgi:hypothetical protein
MGDGPIFSKTSAPNSVMTTHKMKLLSARVGKNPVKKKTQPSGFFGVFCFFLGFFAQTRGFLGFFSVSQTLLGVSRL